MRLLVTGGLGFIASNFIRYILERHSDIVITNIDNLSIGANPANLRDIEGDPRYNIVKGETTEWYIENGFWWKNQASEKMLHSTP